MIRLGRISYVNMAPVFFRLDAPVEEVVGVPDRAERAPARGWGRPRADLVDRLRPQRGGAAPAAPPLCLVRGRGRLDPAGLANASGPGSLDRRHARERDLGRAREGALPRGGAGAARRRGRSDASDRRRRAAERVRGSGTALRPRPALDRANRAADGVRRLGVPRPGSGGHRRARGEPSSRPSGSRAPSPSGSRTRPANATATPRDSSPATSTSCATASDRASAPGCTCSSSSRTRWASWTRSRSCASSSARRCRA